MNQLTEKEKENSIPIEVFANCICEEARISAIIFVSMENEINFLKNQNSKLLNYILRRD